MKRSTNKRKVVLSESQLAAAIEKSVKEYIGGSGNTSEKVYNLTESQIVDIVEEAHKRKRLSESRSTRRPIRSRSRRR